MTVRKISASLITAPHLHRWIRSLHRFRGQDDQKNIQPERKRRREEAFCEKAHRHTVYLAPYAFARYNSDMPKNKAAVHLGRLSWESRKKTQKSSYFSDLSKKSWQSRRKKDLSTDKRAFA